MMAFEQMDELARLGLMGTAEIAAFERRCRRLLDGFAVEYPGRSGVRLFSSPGRTEICGNHTDHQNGRVICAAVDRDILAAAAPNGLGIVRLRSEGFPDADCVELASLDPRPEEAATSAALIRGIAAGLSRLGLPRIGVDVFTSSNVPAGSGLSSSAAFEMLVATILEAFAAPDRPSESRLSPLEKARIGQLAENGWFGKPSGLMDQSACAAGGLLAIDFADPERPILEPIALDLDMAGYDLVIVHPGGSHVGLTGEYAAIPAEMRAVASLFGKRVLRDVDEASFNAVWPEVRQRAGDRALLRAIHFFDENRRVATIATALSGYSRLSAGGSQPLADDRRQQGEPDMGVFLKCVSESGISSWTLLQNLHVGTHPEEQPLSVGLALAARLLQGEGACRVHGGGFGGTFQAFVPHARTDGFCREMDALFGPGSAEILRIRPAGACEIPFTAS